VGENTTVRICTVTELRLCFEQNAQSIYFKINLPCLLQLHNVNGLVFWGHSTDSSNYLTSKRKLL